MTVLQRYQTLKRPKSFYPSNGLLTEDTLGSLLVGRGPISVEEPVSPRSLCLFVGTNLCRDVTTISSGLFCPSPRVGEEM